MQNLIGSESLVAKLSFGADGNANWQKRLPGGAERIASCRMRVSALCLLAIATFLAFLFAHCCAVVIFRHLVGMWL